MLKFSRANAKTVRLKQVPVLAKYLTNNKKVYSFDLPAGHACPFAKDCRSCVVDGKIQDGPNIKFRCFSATQEVLFSNVYRARKHNFDRLRGLCLNDTIIKLEQNIPADMGICRLHVSGDFFSSNYMLAWSKIATKYKHILFYAYTKSLRYWIKHREHIKKLPNFILTASQGGVDDKLIRLHRLRYAKVVFSEKESHLLGLPIDHDDSHATVKTGNFALLLHGVQPAKSIASQALIALKGVGSYNRKRGVKYDGN